MVLGENGAPAHSLYNMSGETNTALQGALVAAFNGMFVIHLNNAYMN